MPYHFNVAVKKYLFLFFIILSLVPHLVNAGENSKEAETYQEFFEVTGAKQQYEQMLNITQSSHKLVKQVLNALVSKEFSPNPNQ